MTAYFAPERPELDEDHVRPALDFVIAIEPTLAAQLVGRDYARVSAAGVKVIIEDVAPYGY